MFRTRLILLVSLLSPPAAALAQAGDWDVVRDPFDRTVIARYKAILAKNPHDAGALAKLLELYKRYRTIDLLRGEYQKQVDGNGGSSALIILGKIDRSTGDTERALASLNKATADRKQDAQLWILIGELTKPSDAKLARKAFDQALTNAATTAQKKTALRSLADLALAANDIDGANGYFKTFLELEPKNAQLWIERGDAMLAAGKKDIALESYRSAEKLLGTDPARRVEVVARIGQTLDSLNKSDESVAEYNRAIKLAPKGYYLETELTNRIIDIYRRQQNLTGLVAEYESKWPQASRGHFEWSTLGKLYEETGAQEKAVAALRQAALKAPWEIDTQRRLISLLENSGRDDEALAQFEAVVKAAPGEARFQLDLADRYWRRGKKDAAAKSLKNIENRFGGDAGILSAVADLYQRWGQENQAIAIYERLAKLEPDDPNHLLSLGEQYFAKGEKERAFATWRKIADGKSSKNFVRLAEVLAEHGKHVEAIELYGKALKAEPNSVDIYRSRATVLEQNRDFTGAVADWEKVLSLLGDKATERSARRDARKRMVSVLLRARVDSPYRSRWTAAFRGTPPNVDAGYFLAELYSKAPVDTPDRQPLTVLNKLHSLVPDDQEILMDLVKAHRVARNYDDAVALLLKLTTLAPSREREAFAQIAEIKSEARRDDEAIEWSQKALAKSPNDPVAHERMGQRYLEMQRLAEAVASYEKSVALDSKNPRSAFALADLYIRQNASTKAADLYRNIIRNVSDEDVIRRAGRLSIDLEEITQTLGSLERMLTPLSYVMSHKPVYRHLVVDLLTRYVPRLAERSRNGSDELAKAADDELARLGASTMRPLLEALRDDRDPNNQWQAITVLGHLGNRDATMPLIRLATAPKQAAVSPVADIQDDNLRVEATLAAARLADPTALSEISALSESSKPRMRAAATFALANMLSPKATPALIRRLDDASPAIVAIACLGLAQNRDQASSNAVAAIANDQSRAMEVRAACGLALARNKHPEAEKILLALVRTSDDTAQALAAHALWELGSKKSISELIAAYFLRSQSATSRNTIATTIIRLATDDKPPSVSRRIPVPASGLRGTVDLSEITGALRSITRSSAASNRTVSAEWLDQNVTTFASAIRAGLSEHRDSAMAVLNVLDAAQNGFSLGDLAPVAVLNSGQSQGFSRKLAELIEPTLVSLAETGRSNSDTRLVTKSLSLLGKVSSSEASAAAILAGLSAGQASAHLGQQQVGALSAARSFLARTEHRGLKSQVVQLAASSDWQVRAAAVAVGVALSLFSGTELEALSKDRSGFVRQAVAANLPRTTATKGLLQKLRQDEVSAVAEAAKQ